MNTLENTIRAAFEQTAEEITPQRVPPLRLPGRTSRRTGGPSRRARRWPVWLTPLAAAASVAAVVSGSLAVTSLVGGHGATGHGAVRPPAARTGSIPLTAAPAAPDGVPAYVVGLSPGPLSAGSTRAVVRATATGAVLATIGVPKPFRTFTWVTGAANDRTFVLAAHIPSQPRPLSSRPGRHSSQQLRAHAATQPTRWGATKFFLLRLHPGSGTARLTALPIPEIHGVRGVGSVLDGIALSPDGRRLAVATGYFRGARNTLAVYDLATGAARAWTGSGRAGFISAAQLGANPLSWEADGRMLAFDVWRGRMTPAIDVRLLDTAGPGGALWSSARLMTFPDWPSGSVAGSAAITGDGGAIVAMAVPGSGPGGHPATQILLNEFSARTGKLVRVLRRWHYRPYQITGGPDVQWSNATGSTLIVSVTAPDAIVRKHGGLTKQVTGIVSHGRFTPLPGIPAGEDPAW